MDVVTVATTAADDVIASAVQMQEVVMEKASQEMIVVFQRTVGWRGVGSLRVEEVLR